MKAVLRNCANGWVYGPNPVYAHGRFHLWAGDRDSVAFLCPGDFVRAALRHGGAVLAAEGSGLGWHYPYGGRRTDDGNVRSDVTRLNLSAAHESGSLHVNAELSIGGAAPAFVVRITLDPADLADIGPDDAELWYGKPFGQTGDAAD